MAVAPVDMPDQLARRGALRAAVVALRPRQWSKNLLLFAGLLFAAKLGDAHRWLAPILTGRPHRMLLATTGDHLDRAEIPTLLAHGSSTSVTSGGTPRWKPPNRVPSS